MWLNIWCLFGLNWVGAWAMFALSWIHRGTSNSPRQKSREFLAPSVEACSHVCYAEWKWCQKDHLSQPEKCVDIVLWNAWNVWTPWSKIRYHLLLYRPGLQPIRTVANPPLFRSIPIDWMKYSKVSHCSGYQTCLSTLFRLVYVERGMREG